MEEIWKPIKDYEGLYEISNFGEIRSLPRNGTIKQIRVLKKILDNNGYFAIELSKCYQIKRFMIHRLVAEAFIDKIDGKNYINHKNGIKTDNYFENLEWCTIKENNIHAIQNNLRPSLYGKDNKNSKTIYKIDINTNKIIEIFYGVGEIERKTNYDSSFISKCCRKCKHYNTAYGYKWRYKEDYLNV